MGDPFEKDKTIGRTDSRLRYGNNGTKVVELSVTYPILYASF